MAENQTEGKTFHMSTSIEGLLHHFKRKKINFVTDNDGSYMSDAEARKQLREMLARGERYIKSDKCFNFDSQNGCPGHTKEEIRQHEIAKAKAKLTELEAQNG